MNIKLSGKLSGKVAPPPSKSQAHRILICAALGRTNVMVYCDSLNNDLKATMNCLNALGANIEYKEGSFFVTPVDVKKGGELHCGESGSTLRFILPIAAVLGADATLYGEGKLPFRPLGPLCEVMNAHGVEVTSLTTQATLPLLCKGNLKGGDYELPGDISSQYLTGLLFALPVASEDSTINIVGELTSASYVGMTLDALFESGIEIQRQEKSFYIKGNQIYNSPSLVRVEGDWSSAAFWLVAGCIGKSPVTCTGMRMDSLQGDRYIISHLRAMGGDIRIDGEEITAYPSTLKASVLDCSDTPDLVPILAIAAACAKGETKFISVGRLRYKESDRLLAMQTLLKNFSIDSIIEEDQFLVTGGHVVVAGSIDSFNDHRIAMSAAIMSTVSHGVAEIIGADCVSKSYPMFFENFAALGGKIY